MFRNILVHIPTDLSPRPAVDGSISLALGTGAHLDAIAIGYETASIPFVAEGGAAVASLYEVEHADRDGNSGMRISHTRRVPWLRSPSMPARSSAPARGCTT